MCIITIAAPVESIADGIAANREWARAESMLLRARADADLALLLFLKNAVKSEKQAAEERLREIQEYDNETTEIESQPKVRQVP